jgi:glycosyltransferase involved in cell wall biosynthesis
MRIVFLTHQYFPHHVGGTEVFTRGLVRRARAQGYEPLVVSCQESACASSDEFEVVRCSYEDVPLVEIHFNLACTEQPSLYEYKNKYVEQVLSEVFAEFQPQLVQVMHAMKLSAGVYDVIKKLGLPCVTVLADFWFLCPRHSLLTYDSKLCTGPAPTKCLPCTYQLHGYPRDPKSIGQVGDFVRDVFALSMRPAHLKSRLLNCDRIFALSRFQREKFIENGYPANRLELLEHGIEPADLASSFSSGEQRELGFVGSIVPEKGLHVVLEALERLAAEGLRPRLSIWGTLPESAYGKLIMKKVQAFPPGQVSLKGTFAPERMGEVFSSFGALLVPALWYENNPLVVKTALRMKIPVLASNLGSLPELIEDGLNGWLLAPGGVDDWQQKIKELLAVLPSNFSFNYKTSMDDTWEELYAVYKSLVKNG